ncbi:hypothetical protein RLEG12_01190 (plasmid) [Rhizobium leguminosarum bv. trifolii CB782]|nr:hypothetical protein RLEG12_01190 [Rhizobium leguminosarum bv. trifolii CB782]
MAHKSLVSMPRLTDDLLLHSQPAHDHVEFAPPLEGKAVDELLMISTRAGSSTSPAPGLHRRRLSSAPRRNLPWQTFQMPLGLLPGADAFASGFETPMSIATPPAGFASRRRKIGLSADNESVLLANSTPENSGVACAMFD